MPDKEIDRREELFNQNSDVLVDSCGDGVSCLLMNDAKMVMDQYFTERAYELLEYMAKNDIKCTWYNHEVLGKQYVFKYRGQELTKEQLFENFL